VSCSGSWRCEKNAECDPDSYRESIAEWVEVVVELNTALVQGLQKVVPPSFSDIEEAKIDPVVGFFVEHF